MILQTNLFGWVFLAWVNYPYKILTCVKDIRFRKLRRRISFSVVLLLLLYSKSTLFWPFTYIAMTFRAALSEMELIPVPCETFIMIHHWWGPRDVTESSEKKMRLRFETRSFKNFHDAEDYFFLTHSATALCFLPIFCLHLVLPEDLWPCAATSGPCLLSLCSMNLWPRVHKICWKWA